MQEHRGNVTHGANAGQNKQTTQLMRRHLPTYIHGPVCAGSINVGQNNLFSLPGSQGTREPGAGVALKGSWAGMPWQSAAQLAEKVVNWNLTISKSV